MARLGSYNRQEELCRYDRRFGELDVNGDGSLALKELLVSIATEGFACSPCEVKVLFESMDTDGNSKITRAEFNNALSKLSDARLREFALRRCFKALDKNNSGTLTFSEIRNASDNVGFEVPCDVIARLMNLEARDQDGEVDYNEFARIFADEAEVDKLKVMFDNMDKNKDGHLTSKEIQTAMMSISGTEQKMDVMTCFYVLQTLKKDNDKKFTLEEFKIAVQDALKKK